MEIVNYYMKENTSGEYLLKCVHGRANIISYGDLKHFNNIDQILKNGLCFILIETSEGSGHWICAFRLEDKGPPAIEIFNSYGGGFIDYEIAGNYVPDKLRKRLNEDWPYLTELLLKSKQYVYHYNNYPLQSENKDIATCGRHCIIRQKFRDLPIDKYYKLIISFPYTPDELVTILSLEMCPGN